MGGYLTRSFIVPELREEMNKLYHEKSKEERPILDEQEMEIINRILLRSYQEGQKVIIRYWREGAQEVTGRITRIDMGKLTVTTDKQTKASIMLNDIISATDVGTPEL